MTSITLPARDLVEALRFALSTAGKTDTRYMINGVCVDNLNGRTIIVGTDGHRMAAVHLRDSVGSADNVQRVYARASVERAIKMFPKPGVNSIAVMSADQLTIDGVSLPMELLEGRYVDWRRVDRFGQQGRVPAALIGLNVDFISEAGRACKRLANRKYGGVKMHVGGAHDTLIFEPNLVAEDFPTIEKAYIQIMPMRLA